MAQRKRSPRSPQARHGKNYSVRRPNSSSNAVTMPNESYSNATLASSAVPTAYVTPVSQPKLLCASQRSMNDAYCT